MNDSCPCVHVAPCHERCSCVTPTSSSGCRRCCSYGSKDQQRAAAEHLVNLEVIAREALVRHRMGDFQRTMPTSGYTLIKACDVVVESTR